MLPPYPEAFVSPPSPSQKHTSGAETQQRPSVTNSALTSCAFHTSESCTCGCPPSHPSPMHLVGSYLCLKILSGVSVSRPPLTMPRKGKHMQPASRTYCYTTMLILSCILVSTPKSKAVEHHSERKGHSGSALGWPAHLMCFWSFSVSRGLFYPPQTGSTVPWVPVLLMLSHFPSRFLIFLSSLDPTSVSHLLGSPAPAPTVSSLLACPFSRQTLHLAASGASGLSTPAPAGEGPHVFCVIDHLQLSQCWA